MKRRDVIGLLGGAAAAWPFASLAQGERPRRIGYLSGLPQGESGASIVALKTSLEALGWSEGRNLIIDYRWAGDQIERIHDFAKEIIDLKPDGLLAHGTPAVAALQAETKTIPIVFVVVSDPVGSGFVASLPRPGGNITGFINLEASLGGKWVELLKDILPDIKRAVLIFNPDTAPFFGYYRDPFDAAAHSLGIEPVMQMVRSSTDIGQTVADLEGKNAGLVVMPDVFTASRQNIELIIALAARHRVPTVYPYRFMTAAGALLSYGVDPADLYRRAATYLDRIFKGAKPTDLPVQLPTKFELAINLKTAKALGITFPPALIGQADEVIE
jgi:ABC-type uncharacterized transport system substrate-binding protein